MGNLIGNLANRFRSHWDRSLVPADDERNVIIASYVSYQDARKSEIASCLSEYVTVSHIREIIYEYSDVNVAAVVRDVFKVDDIREVFAIGKYEFRCDLYACRDNMDIEFNVCLYDTSVALPHGWLGYSSGIWPFGYAVGHFTIADVAAKLFELVKLVMCQSVELISLRDKDVAFIFRRSNEIAAKILGRYEENMRKLAIDGDSNSCARSPTEMYPMYDKKLPMRVMRIDDTSSATFPLPTLAARN
jgi:hypothetical protein